VSNKQTFHGSKPELFDLAERFAIRWPISTIPILIRPTVTLPNRAQRFEEEKKQLKVLPPSPFELSEWRAAKVHPDCHIQVEKNFYSVPFVYVGQNVRVRLTDKLVEVFNEDSQACGA